LRVTSITGDRRYEFATRFKVAAAASRGGLFPQVNTNGGNKWTFPKGSTEARLSHSQAAEREAAEEAGALGTIEPRHFHLYIHSKGVFWQPGGVQEFVVKAFLMEIHELRRPDELQRHPTWFTPEEAKKRLVKGREVKYARELEAAINRALERIEFQSELWGEGTLRRVMAGP
jgi:8-oxo-dGTP pyrophosphatase MutT (NUDIX family)